VTRAKDNMAYEIVGQQTKPHGRILLDATIRLTVEKSRRDYPERMRLVVAVVQVDGKKGCSPEVCAKTRTQRD